MDEFLDLSSQRRNGEKEDGDGDGDQREEHQGDAQDSRNVALLQPINEWVENHREEKNDGEKQKDGTQRTKNRPSDDEKKDEQNNPPRPDVRKRFMLVVGFDHGACAVLALVQGNR